MAAANCSGGSLPASSRSVRIRPLIRRGGLLFAVGDVAFPDRAQAVCAGSAAEAHRLDIVDQQAPDAPLRRCDECALNLGRDVLRALGACPRWGKPRHGIETRCPAYVAKDGAR